MLYLAGGAAFPISSRTGPTKAKGERMTFAFFKDPVKWTEKLLGTKYGIISGICMHISSAFFLIMYIFFPCSIDRYLATFVVIFLTSLSITYLRALKELLGEN